MNREVRPVIAVQARDLRPGDILAEGGVELTNVVPSEIGTKRWVSLSWEREDAFCDIEADAWVAIIEPSGGAPCATCNGTGEAECWDVYFNITNEGMRCPDCGGSGVAS